jgi:hypothetical protein
MSDQSRLYGEGRESIPAIDAPTVIFMINKALPRGSWNDEDVYRAASCAWVIGEEARNRTVYALGVSHGVVRGAYKIVRWHQVGENRWCFDGLPATDIAVVGTSIERLKGKQGNANPVRLFLDGIPAAES